MWLCETGGVVVRGYMQYLAGSCSGVSPGLFGWAYMLVPTWLEVVPVSVQGLFGWAYMLGAEVPSWELVRFYFTVCSVCPFLLSSFYLGESSSGLHHVTLHTV